MFDIGFAELLIIGVVALIVIGPERLPGAIRTGSAWLNRFRRSFNEIKREVQQELHNDAVMRDLRESGEKLRRETESLRSELGDLKLPEDRPGQGKASTEAGASVAGPTEADVVEGRSTENADDGEHKPS
jgi:sec-independent protein translocase protein TatB